jgi:hypothetical protein
MDALRLALTSKAGSRFSIRRQRRAATSFSDFHHAQDYDLREMGLLYYVLDEELNARVDPRH